MSQITAVITTLVLVFVTACLGVVVSFGTDVLDVGAGEWKGVLAAGIAAVATFAYNWLNPAIKRYGVGSE